MVSCLEILKNFEKGASKKEFERHPSFIVIGPTSENVGRWKTSLPVAVIQISRGGVLVSGFTGYVPLPSQNPHPITVYSVASYRPHSSHFWANAIVIMRVNC